MSDELTRLQDLMNETRLLKKERKEIKDGFKDELANNESYQKIIEQMETMKSEKKSAEIQVRESSPGDAQKLEDLEAEIKANEELMSDLAFNLLMANKTVELKDEYNNRYIPHFSVKFKKEDSATEGEKA